MEDGTEWINAPKPILTDDNYKLGTPEDVTLHNKEIVFDAPNVVRMGNDILAQISNSGNHLGFQWLKTILEPRGYRIHTAEKFYSYSHFDSTILPLRPGLVLFNSDRLSPERYPDIFNVVQDELRRVLGQHGIETIGLPMRHARTLSGGFHCVTLDVKRKGTRQDYF